MMKSNIEYGLRGAFKADTYDGQGNLVDTTDWFDNFITQTGLTYPTIYSFANCFRYLSIGSDNELNRGGNSNDATKELKSPITSYTIQPGDTTQPGTWIGWQGYETGNAAFSQSSSCQTQLTSQGLRFFRAWSIPTGAYGITINEPGGYLNIQELAVSPGNESDSVGKYAFSRVQRNLPIPNGHRVIISYQLQVNCQNYTPTTFPSGTFQTGYADITNDYGLVRDWGLLSGYYRQVWPGLSVVDNYGATRITKLGNGMEPRLTDLSNQYLYFSPDNAAFDVNGPSGGTQSSISAAWAANGLMTPITDSTMVLSVANQSLTDNDFTGVEQVIGVPTKATPFSIRLGVSQSHLKTVNVANYTTDALSDGFCYQGDGVNAQSQTISYATPGVSGLNASQDLFQKAVFSSRIYKLPMDMSVSGNNVVSGRKKTITRRAIFTPANSLGYNTRFGSMVLATQAQDSTTPGQVVLYPLIDSLFYDSSGNALTQHYRLISGLYLTQRGSGIAACSITISPSGPNIQRFVARKTFQGGLSGSLGSVPPYVPGANHFLSGWLGAGVVGVGGTSGTTGFYSASANGSSGWGAVLGVLGNDYDDGTYPYDQGVARHHTGSLVEPTGGNPSQLYWPYANVGTPLRVDFNNIIFKGGGDNTLWPDNPAASVATLATSGFCRPTGYIMHVDAIGGQGYRLLPNHGTANIGTSDTYYPPAYGGVYPALSQDNGLEVYFDISWSSPCGNGVEGGTCTDP